jgi:hypothetical protein
LVFIDSGRTMEIILATTMKGETTIADPVVDAVIKTIKENRIDQGEPDRRADHRPICFEPQGHGERQQRHRGGREEMGSHRGGDGLRHIDLSHHARKTGGGEVTVEDGRGASALLAAVRSARSVNTMTRDEADTAG